jgi:hypothetical protein
MQCWKNIFWIQTEFTGIWLNNEINLLNYCFKKRNWIENDFAVGDHSRVASLNMVVNGYLIVLRRYSIVMKTTYFFTT